MKKDSMKKSGSRCRAPGVPGTGEAAMSRACALLKKARITSCDLIASGSNYVFLAMMVADGLEVRGIYKPRRGEIPLWDFPDGTLYKREYAAFIISEALEWHLIPPTVIRSGPYGIGSMQWFVDAARSAVCNPQVNDAFILKRVALFDYLVNNADRKAGHFLEDKDGRLWLVDHGLTFNAEPKLRTVLWNFSGEAIPDSLLADVKVLQSRLNPEQNLRGILRRLLEEPEIEALEHRIMAVIEKPVFVHPGPHRSVPWPWF